jgi:hypothetical protein
MLEQDYYVREKLREFDLRQGTYEPISVPLKRPIAFAARGTGRALLWLGSRLESWAEPPCSDCPELDLGGEAR